MSEAALVVLFSCPATHVAVSASEPPMTRAQFNLWLYDFRTPRPVPCPACGATHVLTAQDYFREGDRES
jgi:hypothetical protein